MDALDVEKWKFVSNSAGKSVWASAVLLGLALIGRASFIFPLSFLSNFTKNSNGDKIEFKQQVSGLMTKPLVRLFVHPPSKHVKSA
ncbi:hypothetical protein LguiA_011424 [Lonicera macranthoides]